MLNVWPRKIGNVLLRNMVLSVGIERKGQAVSILMRFEMRKKEARLIARPPVR